MFSKLLCNLSVLMQIVMDCHVCKLHVRHVSFFYELK